MIAINSEQTSSNYIQSLYLSSRYYVALGKHSSKLESELILVIYTKKYTYSFVDKLQTNLPKLNILPLDINKVALWTEWAGF